MGACRPGLVSVTPRTPPSRTSPPWVRRPAHGHAMFHVKRRVLAHLTSSLPRGVRCVGWRSSLRCDGAALARRGRLRFDPILRNAIGLFAPPLVSLCIVGTGLAAHGPVRSSPWSLDFDPHTLPHSSRRIAHRHNPPLTRYSRQGGHRSPVPATGRDKPSVTGRLRACCRGFSSRWPLTVPVVRRSGYD